MPVSGAELELFLLVGLVIAESRERARKLTTYAGPLLRWLASACLPLRRIAVRVQDSENDDGVILDREVNGVRETTKQRPSNPRPKLAIPQRAIHDSTVGGGELIKEFEAEARSLVLIPGERCFHIQIGRRFRDKPIACHCDFFASRSRTSCAGRVGRQRRPGDIKYVIGCGRKTRLKIPIRSPAERAVTSLLVVLLPPRLDPHPSVEETDEPVP